VGGRTSHDKAAATVGGVSGAERSGPPWGGGAPQSRGAGRASAGCNRHRRGGRGGAPGAPKREAIGTAVEAEVGYREHQCGPVRVATGTAARAQVGYRAHNGGRQSAVPSGQRWGTGRTRAGGNRHRREGSRGWEGSSVSVIAPVLAIEACGDTRTGDAPGSCGVPRSRRLASVGV